MCWRKNVGMLKVVYVTSITFKNVEHERNVAVYLYNVDVDVSPEKRMSVVGVARATGLL
jgi:hypothetical protein